MKPNRSVVQDWVSELPMMQQTVLLELARGPDGITKYHPSKFLIRWIRRCILYCALEREVIDNPHDPRGGSYTGPSFTLSNVQYTDDFDWRGAMDGLVGNYLKSVDEMPHHYHLHLMHGIEILGYKHPDTKIRDWFAGVYLRFCADMHVRHEEEHTLDYRLGDSEEQWRKTADPATVA